MIKGGCCQLGRKVVAQISKSDLPLEEKKTRQIMQCNILRIVHFFHLTSIYLLDMLAMNRFVKTTTVQRM